ncbi:UNVERIFIED_CONTAM: ABC-2 type transport system permease protein [Acetivibrio alkalicellulosi]
MKTFLKLIKLNINVALGISVLKYRFTKEKKKLWEPILVMLGAIFGFGCMFVFFSIFMFGTYITLKEQGQPETVLAIAFLGASFFLLFFGVFHILSAFYFSNDLEFLVPLPLKPYQVMGSKFINMILNEYLIALPMVIPAIIIYGIGMRQGLFYWIKGLVTVLSLPIIPLALSSVLVTILMRFINIKKSKDIIIVFMSFVGLIIGLGANFFIQKLIKGEGSDIEDITQIPAWLIEEIGRRFPPAIWATFGVAREGMEGAKYFFLFIFVSIFLFAAMLWIGNKAFYKGLLSGHDNGAKKKKIIKMKSMKVLSPIKALFLREWKLLLRSPVFMMNGLAGIIVMPIMVIMTLVTQQDGAIGKIIEMSLDQQTQIYILLGGLAVMILTSSMNIVASTSLSREGQCFWISKIIPVSPRQQILSKFYHGIAISLAGIVFIGLLMVVFLNVSILKLPVLFIIALMSSAIITILDLIIDLINPKLNWTNPHEAVKTNLNGLFGLIISMGYFGFITVFSIGMILFRYREWFIYTSLFFMNLVMLLIGIFILLKMADKRYKNIEI